MLKKLFFRLGGASKKTIIIIAVTVIAVAALLLGVLAAHSKIARLSVGGYAQNYAGNTGRMMGGKFVMPIVSDSANQFVLPQDAAKSGELAVIVNNLDSAKSKVDDVATKNGGSIFSTYIAYASNNVKNGSMVVEVPIENFAVAFSDLKNIGSQIVQESTLEIPARNIIYPYPLSAEPAVQAAPSAADAITGNAATISDAASKTNTGQNADSTVSSAPSAIAMPISYQQLAQDKGYIKIIFVDYGTQANSDRSNVASAIGVGYMGQNLRDNLLVVVGLKVIVLVILIGFIFLIVKKTLQSLRKTKKKEESVVVKEEPVVHVHVVKQASKARARAVRVKRKM